MDQKDVDNLRNRMEASNLSGDYNKRNFVDVPTLLLRRFSMPGSA